MADPEVVVTGIEPIAPVKPAIAPGAPVPTPAAPAPPVVAPPAVTPPVTLVVTPENWRNSLPDHLKTNPSLEKFSNVEALAGSYINAQKLIGVDKIPMPTNEAELREVLGRLGSPDSADKYAFTDVALPDGMVADEQMSSAFKTKAHELGLLPAQADALQKWFTDSQISNFNSTNVKNDNDLREASVNLRTEWGAQFDEKLALANRAISTFGGDELVQFLSEKGLANNPIVAKTFAKMAEAVSEDKLIDGSAMGMGSSPTQLQGEIDKLRAHPAFFDEYHAEHDSIVQQVNRAMESLHAVKKS